MVERPDLVIQTKGKGGWMIEPQEGMRLLTTRLEERNYQVPEGMLSFALNEWEERYGIYYAAIREILIKHKARNPEGVHIGGKGKRYGISPDILEEIEADINNKVQQLQYESQGYTRLTRQMAKDMNVTILTLYKWLREMEEQGTPGIYRSNRKEFYLEPHVIEMLRQKSPEPLQGESFTVDSRGLAEEYELTQGQITDIVRQLRNRPDLGGHITGIPGKPLSATSEGLHAIREELERRRIPRGYKRVPMGDLTSNSGLPVNRIRRIIDQLKNSGFDAEFTVGGLQNNNCATQTGLRLIIDQVYRETGRDLSYLLGE